MARFVVKSVVKIVLINNKKPRQYLGFLLIMVESRGIEPLSEEDPTMTSTV